MTGIKRIDLMMIPLWCLVLVCFGWVRPATTQGGTQQLVGDAELAQELSNPVADVVSVPFQMNYDQNIGPWDGKKLQTNIQPVIPFHLNDDWNLITRTIFPVICQDDILPGSGTDFERGDINLSLFFSPKKPASGVCTGASDRSCSCLRRRRTCLAQRNGVLDRQRSRLRCAASGRSVPWEAISGPMQAKAAVRTSATHSCSPSPRIPGQAPGARLCSPRAHITGRPRSGPCRSISLCPRGSDGASCLSVCMPASGIGWNHPTRVLRDSVFGCKQRSSFPSSSKAYIIALTSIRRVYAVVL